MKFISIITLGLMLLGSTPVFGHAGGTDANGWHTDRATGRKHQHTGSKSKSSLFGKKKSSKKAKLTKKDKAKLAKNTKKKKLTKKQKAKAAADKISKKGKKKSKSAKNRARRKSKKKIL